MCEFCGEVPQKVVEHTVWLGDLFIQHGKILQGLAYKTIKPHTDEMKRQTPNIKIMLRELMEWL